MSADVYKSYLTKRYAEEGLNPAVGMAIAQIESQWNPNATNKKGSGAAGLMQFMPNTAKEFRINPYDPYQSIEASIRYLKQARARGIDISNPGHAYLAWQQGAGGAKKLLSANQSAPIESVIGQKNASMNGMAGLTVGQAVEKWAGKANKLAGMKGMPTINTATGLDYQQPKVANIDVPDPTKYIQPSMQQPKAEQYTIAGLDLQPTNQQPQAEQYTIAGLDLQPTNQQPQQFRPTAAVQNSLVRDIMPQYNTGYGEIDLSKLPIIAAVRKLYG